MSESEHDTPRQRQRKRSIPKRLLRLALALGLLLLVARLVLELLIPTLIDFALSEFRLRAEYEDVSVSLLSGNVEIRGARIFPVEGGDALIEFDHARCDLDIAAILGGDLHIQRLIVDNADIRITRGPDGEFDLIRRLAGETTSLEEEDGEEDPAGILPPFQADAVHLLQCRVHFRDETIDEVLEARLDFNLTVRHFGHDHREAGFEFQFGIDSLVDFVRIKGPFVWVEDHLDAEIEFRMSGLRAEPVSSYLKALSLRPTAALYDLSARVRISLREAGTEGLLADLAADDLRLWADGRETLGVGQARATGLALGPEPISFRRIEVSDAFAGARRPRSGEIEVGGFELLPDPDGANEAVAATGPPAALGEVVARDIRLDLLLADRDPALPLSLQISRASLTPGESGLFDAALKATAPGLIGAIDVTGSLRLDASEFSGTVSVADVTPEPLVSRLRDLGIEPMFTSANLAFLTDGRFDTDATGGHRAALAIREFTYSVDDERIEFAKIEFEDAELDPDGNRYRLGRVRIEGDSLSARRDTDGALEIAGLRFPVSDDSRSGDSPDADQAFFSARVELGDTEVLLRRLSFDDATIEPPLPIEALNTRLVVRNLAVGGAEDSPHLDGQLEFETRLTDMADRVAIAGRLNSGGAGSSLALEIEGTGLKGTAVERRLAASGVESRIEDASLRFGVIGNLRGTEEGLTADLAVNDFSLVNRGEEVASLTRLAVKGFRFSQGQLQAQSVVVTEPTVRILREKDELLAVLGMRLGKAMAEEGDTAKSTADDEETPALRLDEFRLEQARLTWRDEAIEPPREVTILLSAGLTDILRTEESVEGRFSLDLALADSNSRFSADGTTSLNRADSAFKLELKLEATGIRPAEARPYLPGDPESVFSDGRLGCTMRLEVADAREGGRSWRLTIDEFDCFDAADQEPRLSFPHLSIDIPRIDLEEGVLEIAEVDLKGLTGELRRSTDGGVFFLGQRLSGGARAVATKVETADGQVSFEEFTDALLASMDFRNPQVRIDRLTVGLAQFRLLDDRRPDALPLVFENVRLESLSGIELFGPDPENVPPARLALSGSVPTLLDSIRIDIEAAPSAAEPWIGLELKLEGIRDLGERIAVLPATLDLSRLVGGRASAKLHGTMKVRQTMAEGIDWSRGFSGHLVARDVLVADAAGEPLFKLNELDAAVPLIHLGKGILHVSVLDLVNPSLVVTRTEEGLEIAGVILRKPEGAPDGSSGTPEIGSSSSPPFELRIDSMYISDLNLTWSSTKWSPPVVIPLTGVDFEMKGFTTEAFREERAIRFEVAGFSDEVPLPLEGNPKRDALEEVAVRGHLSFVPVLTGWIEGMVRGVELSNFRGVGSASGFTLNDGLLDVVTVVRFAEEGVTEISVRNLLTDLDLSEPADGPIQKLLLLPTPLNTVIFVLQDSSGQIEIPLEFTMQSGALSEGAVTSEAIKALTGAITSAIAGSPLTLASAALSVMDFGAGLLGLGKNEEALADEPPLHLEFLPGDARLSAEAIRKLEELDRTLRGDKSLTATIDAAFGEEDITLCRQRANPTQEDSREYAEGLRRKRNELLRSREEARAEVRSALAAGVTERFDAAVAAIREIDQAIAKVDLALNEILAVLRPGAELRMDRRMRGAASRLGAERLVEVRQQLSGMVSEDVAGRIRIRRSRYDPPVKEGGGRVVVTLRRKRK